MEIWRSTVVIEKTFELAGTPMILMMMMEWDSNPRHLDPEPERQHAIHKTAKHYSALPGKDGGS